MVVLAKIWRLLGGFSTFISSVALVECGSYRYSKGAKAT